MKPLPGNIEIQTDLVGEYIEIWHDRARHYEPITKHKTAEGRVRAVWVSNGLPIFLLENADSLAYVPYDSGGGWPTIKIIKPPKPVLNG